jgi:hypothetical protein
VSRATVNAGTLVVNADFGDGLLTLAGGTLAGSGTVDILGTLFGVGGTIAPGPVGGVGTLHAREALLNATSTLALDLNSNTAFDQLVVSENVSLAQTALSLTLGGGFVPAVGQVFPIVNNVGIGPTSGTFAGLPEGSVFSTSGGVQFRINYRAGTDGNDVVITRVSAPRIIADSFQFQTARLLVFTFNTNVPATLSESDLIVKNLTTGATLSPTNFTMTKAGGSAVFTFNGGVMPDGNYAASLDTQGVTDAEGDPLENHAPLAFFLLNGDADHDRTVGPGDFNLLASHFGQSGQTWGNGDFDGDGVVGPGDFNLLASRFGSTLSAASLDAGSTGVASGVVATGDQSSSPLDRPRAKTRRPKKALTLADPPAAVESVVQPSGATPRAGG